MTKQTKLYLGIGLVAVAGYLIWKQSQNPKTDGTKNAVGDRTLNTMLADDGGVVSGGGASTQYAQACDGKAEGGVCAYVSPRTGDTIFGHCKKTSGGGLSCEK
jgi:hypothetical protein